MRRYGASVVLSNADLRNRDQHSAAFCGPEDLLRQQRAGAAALQVPVTLENARAGVYDDNCFDTMQESLLRCTSHQGIDLPVPSGMVYNSLCQRMFEPDNWANFKRFVSVVNAQAHAHAQAEASSSPGDGAAAAPAAANADSSSANSNVQVLTGSAGEGGAAPGASTASPQSSLSMIG